MFVKTCINTVAKSFDYSTASNKILYGKTGLNQSSVSTLAVSNTAIATLSDLTLTKVTGDIRRGTNGNIYVANTYNNITEGQRWFCL
jgi:hypothetical protein